jgi:hypothetical protein
MSPGLEAANDNIDPNAPLPLKAAAKAAYPLGGMTGRGLRRQASAGLLKIEKHGKQLFTTLAAIGEMRQLCHVNDNQPACGSDRPVKIARQFGSLSTTELKLALAAARATTKAVRERSNATLRKSA